jgi:hypothetical protein
MSRNGAVLLILTALMLACAVSALALDGAEEEPEEPSIEEIYPDADFIITSDSRDHTLLIFKAYGDYKVTDEHPSQWFSRTILSKDLTVCDLSLAKENVNIVFDDAKVNKLILFNIDSKNSMNAAINVHFTMIKGSIQSFSLMSISNNVKQYMSTSYDALPTPIRTADLDFVGGKVDVINPTSLMLSVTNMYLDLDRGMEINRLYITGENGKYSNVYVSVNGARIGYMTNISSKVGYLKYDIVSGEIDYLCIGANTEHSTNRSMSNMATFYVSGDVDMHVGSYAVIHNCIMGAGIINMPRMLCNGDLLTGNIVHMVVIDAQDVTIYNDTTFLNEPRTAAYRFYNYKVGQEPSATSLMDTFIVDTNVVKIYSDNGIWRSISSTTLPAGSILSLNTRFFIQEDGIFNVSKGATLYNSDDIVLCGTLNVEGTLVNNSVIQCRAASTLEGTIDGIGYLADFVNYSTATNSLKVMSERDAVVISLREQSAVEDITATISDGKATVIITVDGSSRIYGNQFMIALNELPGGEEFAKMYRLDIKGIDRNTLSNSTVEVYMNVDDKVCNAIYVQDPETGGYDIIATAEYTSQIKIPAGTHQMFYLYDYTTEMPVLVDEDADDRGMSSFDYLLIAAIVAVLAVTVYALFTMKRD